MTTEDAAAPVGAGTVTVPGLPPPAGPGGSGATARP
jgi:hypothetical protein